MGTLGCNSDANGLVRPGPISRSLRVVFGLATLAASGYAAREIRDLNSAVTPLLIGVLILWGSGHLRLWRVPYIGFGLLPVWLAALIGFPGTVAADILLPSSLVLGLSFLIAGLKGYAGCEITAIPNLFRTQPVEHGCAALWDSIDRWDAERRRPT